jgi:hypothetical protein
MSKKTYLFSTDMLHDANYDLVQSTDAETLQLTADMNMDVFFVLILVFLKFRD